MKRFIIICLILASCIIPVQADILWTNETHNMFNPQLFAEGCNASDKTTITVSHPSEGTESNNGVVADSQSDVDGLHTFFGAYLSDVDTGTNVNTLSGWRQGLKSHYYATCNPDFELNNYLAENTPETAYYIGPGDYQPLSAVVYGVAMGTVKNMSYNTTPRVLWDENDQAVQVVAGLRPDMTKTEPRYIESSTGVKHYFTTTPPGPPIANFTGTPTNGSAPLTVVFTDTSTNSTATSWNWTSTPNTGVFVSPSTNSEDVTMLFTSSGNYTISHCAANDFGSDCEVKTDYIWVYNSTVMITTPWRAEDMVFGGLVANATIDLLDIENDSWVNVTSSTGKSSITTLADHKLSGYGFAVGFNDAEQLIVEPQAFPGYVLYMYPTGFTNVSEGNVTVFVKAEDVDTGLSVIGATVTGQAAGGGSQVKTTNSAGWAQFVFPNNTNVHFKAEKSGYTGSTTIVLNTGVPSGGDTFVSGTVYLTKGSITILPTTTVTTLPGGGTPTPVETYLPHCDPAASDYSAEECRAEQSSFSLSWLADNMLLLIQICFIFTILYIAGWKP